MNKQNHKKNTLEQLREIKQTTINILDLISIDDIDYKGLEASMNYIRLCTQRVQLHFKNYVDFPCELENPDVT